VRRGLRVGSLTAALSRASCALRSPLAPPPTCALLEKLARFAQGGPNQFDPVEEGELVRRGWAFIHDKPKRCVILTHAGWKASGVKG